MGVIGCCILIDLQIQIKSSVIGSIIFKYVLKSCVIDLVGVIGCCILMELKI